MEDPADTTQPPPDLTPIPTPPVPAPVAVVKHPIIFTPATCSRCYDEPQTIPIRHGAKAGISFDLPITAQATPSSTWDKWMTYLQSAIPPKRPLLGTHLVFQMQVVSPNPQTVFNYVGNGINSPGDPAGIRPMIKMGPMGNDNLGMRWWAKQRLALADLISELPITLEVSLDPSNWFGVEGEDPLAYRNGDDFRHTLLNPSNVCLTFGGGPYAGHGVNAYPGPVTFNLFQVYTY